MSGNRVQAFASSCALPLAMPRRPARNPQRIISHAVIESLEPRMLLTATHLVFIQPPTEGIQGRTLSPIQVAIEDGAGNIVADNQTVVSLFYPKPAAPTLTIGSNETDIDLGWAKAQNGIATFNGISINDIGPLQLTANAAGLLAASSTVQIDSNAPKLVFVSQPTPNAVEGAQLGTVQVEIEDVDGNLLTNDQSSVSLSLLGPLANGVTNDLTLAPASVVTGGSTSSLPQLLGTVTAQADNGIATFTNIFIDQVGSFDIRATDGAYTAAVSSSINITPSGKVLVFNSQPPNSFPGMPMGAFSVVVDDPFGNKLTGDAGSITLTVQAAPNTPGESPEIQGTLTQPVTNGFATFDDLSLTSSGYFQFSVSEEGADPVLSQPFIIYTPETPPPDGLPSVQTIAALNNNNGGIVLDAKRNIYGQTQAGGANDVGFIYEIPAGSSTPQNIYSISTNDHLVNDTLTADSKGNLYGIGSDTAGTEETLFELPKGGKTLETLATLTPDIGSALSDTLTVDASGNIFGISNGATGGGGTIYELPKGAHSLKILATFDGANATLSNPLLLDKAGNLYDTESYFSGITPPDVVELPKGKHALQTLAAFGPNDGSSPQGALAIDAKGDIFGASSGGGVNNSGTVFELPEGAKTIKSLSFAFDMGTPLGGMIVDKEGDAFGTNISGQGLLFEIPAGTQNLSYLAGLNGEPNILNTVTPLVIAPNGMLYGISNQGEFGNTGNVFSFMPPATAAKLVIQQQPAAKVADGVVSLKIAVHDAKGKIISNGMFTLTLTLIKGPGTAAADFTPITIDAVDGVATFTNVSLPTVVGTYQFAVSEGTLKPVTSRAVIIKKAPITKA